MPPTKKTKKNYQPPPNDKRTYSFCCRPKLSLPSLPAGVGRARGRQVCGECAGCLWARERLFHNIEVITSKAENKEHS